MSKIFEFQNALQEKKRIIKLILTNGKIKGFTLETEDLHKVLKDMHH